MTFRVVAISAANTTDVKTALTAAAAAGTLASDLGATSVTVEAMTSYDPTSSTFYNALPVTVFDYGAVDMDTLSPSSGSIDGGLVVTISGTNFINKDEYNVATQFVRWVLSVDSSTGEPNLWEIGVVTYVDESTLTIVSPPIEQTYVSTSGYHDAYIQVSFNGATFSAVDYSLYFTYYDNPVINKVFFLADETSSPTSIQPQQIDLSATAFTRIDFFPQAGVVQDAITAEDVALYVIVNATNIYRRYQKLVCIFTPCDPDGRNEGSCSSDQADDLDDCRGASIPCLIEDVEYFRSGSTFEAIGSAYLWEDWAEFACPMPAVPAGNVRLTFSNNRFLGNSYASEVDSTNKPVIVRSQGCGPGEVTASYDIPCETCTKGTYANSERTTCTPCSKNRYQDQTGQDSCEYCPDNTETNSTGASSIYECLCTEGMYTQDRAESYRGIPEPIGCINCPDNAICRGV